MGAAFAKATADVDDRDGRVRVPSRAGGDLGVRRRREPLRRHDATVGARQGSRQERSARRGALDLGRVAEGPRDRARRRSCPTRRRRSVARSARAVRRRSPTRSGDGSPPARRSRSSPGSSRASTTRRRPASAAATATAERDAANQDRRVRQGRAARGRGDRRRAAAEVEEAPEAHGGARPGSSVRSSPESPSTTRRPSSWARRSSSWRISRRRS